METTTTFTATTGGCLWNGPVCPTCGARYLGSHTCATEDILRRVGELLRLLGPPQQYDLRSPYDRTAGCPCRPENGGSGMCGCTLGGPQITC